MLAAIAIEDPEEREAKLALVRKLMLALKKDDEHAACDALESLIEEVTRPSDSSED
jgi:hypothetical protein